MSEHRLRLRLPPSQTAAVSFRRNSAPSGFDGLESAADNKLRANHEILQSPRSWNSYFYDQSNVALALLGGFVSRVFA
jgi:hypothetical protein